jgi:C4-dicarboxylate-binding protein DctP
MKRALAAITAVALTATTPVLADTTLRITLQLPMASSLGQNLTMFKEEVERNSDINVEIYDSAQLYRDAEVPEAVGSGEIEMGVVPLTRFVGEIPAVDVFYMPFTLDSQEKVRAATAPGSTVRGPLDEAILETGSRVLWWQAYGGSILLTKGEPLRMPTDLRDKKVRVFGRWLGEWIRELGGAPTLISGSEQFLAYQRGTVDVGMTGLSTIPSRKMWEVMNTITAVNNANVEFIVLINEDRWRSLTGDQRAVLSTAARNAEVHLRDSMAAIEADAVRQALANGMVVHELSDEEAAAWRAASTGLIEKWLSEAGDLGRQVLDAANDL